MYLNQFSAVIQGGNETAGGYVELQHCQIYQLRLRNDRSLQADARVEIDGKHVGTWRLHSHQTITLERPANDNGQFTFYRLNSPEAQAAALNSGDPNLGLVKVTFTPEKRMVYRGSGGQSLETSFSATTRGAGGTGLSGYSFQEFDVAQNIEYDYSQETVIHLRLVERVTSGEQIQGIRPLTQYSTPVPPRVF